MESSEPPKEIGLLDRLRNMWQFANLMQYIFIFGRAVKIDEDFTIDVSGLTHCATVRGYRSTISVDKWARVDY